MRPGARGRILTARSVLLHRTPNFDRAGLLSSPPAPFLRFVLRSTLPSFRVSCSEALCISYSDQFLLLNFGKIYKITRSAAVQRSEKDSESVSRDVNRESEKVNGNTVTPAKTA